MRFRHPGQYSMVAVALQERMVHIVVSDALLDYLRAHSIIVLSKPTNVYTVSAGALRTTVPEERLEDTLKAIAQQNGVPWPVWSTERKDERMNP